MNKTWMRGGKKIDGRIKLKFKRVHHAADEVPKGGGRSAQKREESFDFGSPFVGAEKSGRSGLSRDESEPISASRVERERESGVRKFRMHNARAVFTGGDGDVCTRRQSIKGAAVSAFFQRRVFPARKW